MRIRKGIEKSKKAILLLGRLGGSGAATKDRQEGKGNSGDDVQSLERETQEGMMISRQSKTQYLYNPVISSLRVAIRNNRI